MTYKEETYYFHYRPIFDAIKELLSNKEIFDNCTFKYTSLYHEGQRIYYEQYNGDWLERVQNSLPRDAKVLSIILYSDATTCDHLGKTSEHPIYLTLGNIISWCRINPMPRFFRISSTIKSEDSLWKKNRKLSFSETCTLSIFFGYIDKTVTWL